MLSKFKLIKWYSEAVFFLFVVLFLTIYLLTSTSLTAQAPEESFDIASADNLVKIIGPSPTAAALGEYGSYPVSGSSGLPSINIPLFEIKGTELSIPVSLSYHGDGVKVDEVASWVGMGWSLNAGGVITRSAVGYPDEEGKGIYGLYNNQGFDPDDPNSNYGMGYEMMIKLATGLHKGEPDLYSYNFLGYSGQFFIDHNQNIYHYNDSDIEISSHNVLGNISSFKVKVGNGTFLTFSAIEDVHVITGDQGEYEAEVAWYLTEILKGKDRFRFYYQEEEINDGYSCSEVGTKADANGARACLGGADREIIQGSSTIKTKQRLHAIIGPHGYAEFHSSPDERIDQSGTHKLDSITFLDQTIRLISRYSKGTYAPSLNCTNKIGPGTGIKERLFLDEVEFVAGKDRKRYLLNYQDRDALPPTKSFDQDHWGYFNDAGNNTLLPKIDGYIMGGDREPDPDAMLAGTLSKITYPTGGYSEFEWEPNRKCKTEQQMVEVCNTLEEYQLYANDPDPFGSGEVIEHQFSITQESNIHFILNVGHFTENDAESGSILITFKDQSNKIYHEKQYELENNVSPFTLPPGNYTVQLENRSPILDEIRFKLWECHEELQTITDCEYYGGLRIHKINNYSSETNKFTSQSYDYKNLTSSRIMTLGGYTKQIEKGCEVSQGVTEVFVADKRHDRSLIQFSSSVNYDSIIEQFDDGSSIVYEYYQLNDNWGGNSYEAILLQDHSWKRNLLKRKTLLSAAKTPVSETYNHYTFISNFVYKGIKVDLIRWNNLNGDNNDHHFAKGTYNMYADWARLDYTTQTLYYKNGNQTRRTNFEYFHPEDLVTPNLITTIDSDGEALTAVTLYPRSFENEDLLWDRLKKSYYLNPIEKVIIKNDKVIKAAVYEYDIFGDLLSNRIIESKNPIPLASFDFSTQTIETAKGSFHPNSYYNSEKEIDLTYNYHGVINKLDRTGINTSYIWGYNELYPVAEIVNLSHDDLLSIVGLEKIEEINGLNHFGPTKTKLLAIRKLLPPSAQMTIYTYTSGGIGIREVIDPNGNSIRYSYDDFGRLKTVHDRDGNLLSIYEYNYALETK